MVISQFGGENRGEGLTAHPQYSLPHFGFTGLNW
jgi:hypothetical protein